MLEHVRVRRLAVQWQVAVAVQGHQFGIGDARRQCRGLLGDRRRLPTGEALRQAVDAATA